MEQRSAIGGREKYIFEEAPIPRAVRVMAAPTVITQLINIIYNYADTWFVGRTQDPAMVAALGVSFPLFVLLAAVANLFGIGGSSVISRSLGMKDPEKARRVFAFCFWGGMAAALFYMLVMALFGSSVILYIGGDENSYPYIRQYIFWTIIVGAVPTVGNVLCGHLVRSVGASRQAGIGMSMGGLLNIALDPLFMFVLLPAGYDVEGAAIATLISNCAAFVYFLIFFARHREEPVFDINIRHVSFSDHIPADVLVIGVPAALQTTLAMVSNMAANALVKGYGTEAVTGLGVAKKINMIAFNTCMGVTMGVLPLIGYNFGSGNFARMKKIIRFTGLSVFSFGCCCTLIFELFDSRLISFFISEPVSVACGAQMLSVLAYAAPLAAVTYMVNVVFQATGHKTESFILSVLRKGVLDVSGMFILKPVMGVMGVMAATPVAEVLSAALAAVLYIRLIRGLGREKGAAA